MDASRVFGVGIRPKVDVLFGLVMLGYLGERLLLFDMLVMVLLWLLCC